MIRIKKYIIELLIKPEQIESLNIWNFKYLRDAYLKEKRNLTLRVKWKNKQNIITIQPDCLNKKVDVLTLMYAWEFWTITKKKSSKIQTLWMRYRHIKGKTKKNRKHIYEWIEGKSIKDKAYKWW